MYEYIGNLHVHSIYSDGRADIKEIARIGKRAGIDFIGITDHHTLKGLKRGEEGWYDGVMVIIGQEVGDRYHHYLAFGIREEIEADDEDPQTIIDRVNEQGGIGFIAHPFEMGCPLFEGGKAYTWNNWNVDGFQGICIWNYTSSWKERVKSPIHGIYYYLLRKQNLKGPSSKALNAWDKLSRQRPVVAIGGSDAHAYSFKMGPFSIEVFPYYYLFRAINTHLLLTRPFLKELEMDRKAILDGLRMGSCFVAHDRVADSRGFRFYALKNGRRWTMGECVEHSSDLSLLVQSPQKGLIRILKDGFPILERVARHVELKVAGKGVYRAEVYARSFSISRLPWIYSNPIYVI